LSHHVIEKFNIDLGEKFEKTSEEALDILMQFDWPGNVRELENAIERAMVITKGDLIKAEELRLSPKIMETEGPLPLSDKRTIKAIEKEHIVKILEESNWNIQKAARILGIDLVTLYNKPKKYNLKKS